MSDQSPKQPEPSERGFSLSKARNPNAAMAKVLSNALGIRLEPERLDALSADVRDLVISTLDALIKEKRLRREAERLSATDPLTGAESRRELKKRLDEMLDRRQATGGVREHNEPYPTATIVMLDVDNFKRFNDDHSHTAGDLALKHLVGILRKNLRDTDHIGRQGGDEFAIIMERTDENTARAKIDGILEKLANTPFTYQEKDQHGNPTATHELFVSASYGATEIQKNDDRELLASRLDQDLKKNKQKNREERVASAETVMIPTPPAVKKHIKPRSSSHAENETGPDDRGGKHSRR